MSTNGSSGSSGGDSGPIDNGPASQRPVPVRIDFVYDHATEGDVAPNAEVKNTDFTEIIGDHVTDTNEVMEVYKIEMIPPANADDAATNPGYLQNFRSIRLWNGAEYYPNLRLREFQLGFFGQDYHLSSKPLGQPVLSGQADPSQDPISTATPKFGPSTSVSPAVQNDGDAITDDFRIRMHAWVFKGSERELQDYFSSTYGQTSFQQNIRMSNPFTGTSETYNRSTPTRITAGASGSAHNQFTKLTGGTDQELPKVNPWATYTSNNQATRANTEYHFQTTNDRVAEPWQQLEFDLTNKRRAVFFETVEVNQHENLQEGRFTIEERDVDPTVYLGNDGAHELPILRPLDGTQRTLHDHDQLPRTLSQLVGSKQVLWNDGGGFRVRDTGTSIPAGELTIGVQGKWLELTS